MSRRRDFINNIDNYIGKRYNHLEILGLGDIARVNTFRCKCDCGNIVDLPCWKVVDNIIRCCKKDCKYFDRAITHGKTHTRLYKIYRDIIMRCYYSNTEAYKYYGLKDVKMCLRWYDPNKTEEQRRKEGNIEYLNFEADAYASGYRDPLPGEPKSEWLTIERLDPTGDYSPENCIWIPRKYQPLNKRTSSYIWDYYDNEWLNYSSFEQKYGLSEAWVNGRLIHGWEFSAIVYAAKHKDEQIRLNRRRNEPGQYKYINKYGFGVLIRQYKPPKDSKYKQVNKNFNAKK